MVLYLISYDLSGLDIDVLLVQRQMKGYSMRWVVLLYHMWMSSFYVLNNVNKDNSDALPKKNDSADLIV